MHGALLLKDGDQMNKSLSFLLLMTVSIILFSTISNNASVDYIGLGGFEKYNAVIFEDMLSYGGNIEGSVAIKGDITVSSSAGSICNLASAARQDVFINTYGYPRTAEDEAYPSLLLGGSLIATDSSLLTVSSISTGSAVIISSIGTASNLEYLNQTHIQVQTDSIRSFFNKAKNDSTFFCENSKKMIRGQLQPNSDFGIGISTTDNSILVSSINIKDEFNVSQINIPNVENKFLIIYCEASSVKFKDGTIMYDQLKNHTYSKSLSLQDTQSDKNMIGDIASRIVWVFPEAETIEINNYDVIGTIIAPNALVQGIDGSINGQMIVNSFEQFPDVHVNNYKLSWTHLVNMIVPSSLPPADDDDDFVDEPIIEEPDPVTDEELEVDNTDLLDTTEILLNTLAVAPTDIVPTNTIVPNNSQDKILPLRTPLPKNIGYLPISIPPPDSKSTFFYWIDTNNNLAIDQSELYIDKGIHEKKYHLFFWTDSNKNGQIDNDELSINDDVLPQGVQALPATNEQSSLLYYILGFFLIAMGIHFNPKQHFNL